MSVLRRAMALGVSVCLLLTAAGCFSGREWAADGGAQVSPGMSMEEVQYRLGDPYQVLRSDRDTEWIYYYDSGPSTACVVFMVIFFVVLIVAVVVASKNNKGHVGGGVFFGVGAGSAGPPYQIRLHFDSDGRLLEVSPPYPAP